MRVQERIIVKGRLKLLKFMRNVGMEKTAAKMRVKIRAFFRMLLLKRFFVLFQMYAKGKPRSIGYAKKSIITGSSHGLKTSFM